jgi:hypothetical protein
MKWYALLLIFLVSNAAAQIKKIDTTVRIGKVAYHILCSNKNFENNLAEIKLIGFDNAARDLNFYIKGKIKKAEIDDFNNDGYPDLVLYVYNGPTGAIGNVVGIASEENKSCVPILFPDIRDDPKLRAGYTGGDEFYLLEGLLFRSYPMKNPADTLQTIKRTIQYKMAKAERGAYKFIVIRTYDAKL